MKKRKFYDLFVSADCITDGVLDCLKGLGFSGVGAVVSIGRLMSSPGHSMELIESLRRRGLELDMDIASRLTIDKPFDEDLIKKILRKYRKKFEIISIQPLRRGITAFACRDTRIDILTLSLGTKIFRGDIDYIRMYDKRVEITLRLLQQADIHGKAKVLAYYQDILRKLCRKKMSTILLFSSGAQDRRELRDPRMMASILHTLGLSYDEALNIISTYPARLVNENRDKLRGLVPARGVKILEDENITKY
ncbi:MAG: RNase P subunit p30 family protein [Thermofilaceae archaeon]